MSRDMKEMIVRDGSSQENRPPKALAPGYFNVDESTLESLVCGAADLSSSIVYTGFDDAPSGNWRAMFESDEAVIFAAMARFDPDRNMRRFVHLRDHQDLYRGIRLIHSLAMTINRWYEALSRINTPLARKGVRRLNHLITKRANRLPQEIERLSRRFSLSLDLSGFTPEWAPAGAGDRAAPEADPGETAPDDIEGVLTSGFYTLHTCLTLIRDHGRLLLKESLASQEHNPAIGLFLAFTRLYGRARDIQNRFTGRHLDFYYDRVLGYRPKSPEPDRVYLSFTKAEKALPVLVPEGTAFPAPPGEEGCPRIYRAAHDLFVTDAAVASLRTLIFEKDPLSAPESSLGMVTGIRTAKIPVRAPSDMTPGSGGNPFFGAGGKRGAGAPGRVGLAVSSPALILGEGTRRVSMTFTLSRIGPPETGLFSTFLDQAAGLSGTSPTDIFFKVFPKAFSLRLTGAEGWLAVPSYTPATAMTDDTLAPDEWRIAFTLPVAFPAVVPWTEEAHGGGFSTAFPVMELAVNPGCYAFPFSVLAAYDVKKIAITANVEGLKDLLLYNHLGRLDPNGPFQPFGPIPEKDAYLIAGSHETAVKRLTRFDLHLSWGGLPTGRNGFETLYRGYGDEFDDPVFTVKASLLSDGIWQPEPENRLALFSETDNDRLSSASVLTADGLNLTGTGNPKLDRKGFEFTIRSRSGFFKYRLDHPARGFGHGVYPHLLTRVLTGNARKSRFTAPDPLPNPPYTPTVISASVCYAAAAELAPGRTASGIASKGESLFHIHPFGIRKIYPLKGQQACPLVPRDHLEGAGSLMIGLKKLVPASRLTLFFLLTESASTASTREVPQVAWYYLKDDQWHPFEAHEVALDTTRGFLTSGVVALDLPPDLDKESAVMGEALYWLRVSADSNLKGPAALFTVAANGLLTVLDDPAAGTVPLPPGAIKEARPALPGITGIIQPQGSFEGRPPEGRKMRNIRLGERLRHKNRAVTPWDYERLILEHFPEVAKAKCFPGISSDTFHCWERRTARGKARNWSCEGCGRFGETHLPGHLLVCIIPKVAPFSVPPAKDPTPMADAVLLSRIRSRLSGLAGVFSAIEVINPVYEKIQVRCTVRFADGSTGLGSRQRLNRDIAAFISPWYPGGYGASFGWRIRRSDLVSHIQSLPYVDFITRFSMLRIARDGEAFHELFDSVTEGAVKPSQDEKQILPKTPWSLAINAEHHFIRTTEAIRPQMPERTGVSELEIGNTFIITG